MKSPKFRGFFQPACLLHPAWLLDRLEYTHTHMAHLTCRSPILSCSNYLHTKLLVERSFSKGKTLVSLKQKNTMAGKVIKRLICITFWNFMFVHPYSVGIYGILSHCQFLQLCHKISLIKVAYNVWKIGMHGVLWDDEKLSYVHHVIRQSKAS